MSARRCSRRSLPSRPGDGDGQRGARGVRSGQDRGAAGKVAEEAVIRVFVILLDILIVVLLEKTTHEPELRSAAVTDGQERAGSNGPKPTGRWATTCARPSSRKRSRPATPAAPTAPSSAARHRVRGRAAPRNARSARAGSPTTSRAVRHSGPRHQPAGRPNAVPAPSRSCRRYQALRGLGHAFTMRHGRRLPWRTSCNARCRRFRINSKWLHVVGTCKFPHRKRGQEIGPCYKGVLGLVHGPV